MIRIRKHTSVSEICQATRLKDRGSVSESKLFHSRPYIGQRYHTSSNSIFTCGLAPEKKELQSETDHPPPSGVHIKNA